MRDGHQQSGGDPFAGNIPDAEDEFVVADVVIIQVATHKLGWHLQTADIDFLGYVWKRIGRQQRLLDVAGDGEFVLNVLLLGTHLV